MKQEIEVISETLDVQQYVLKQAQHSFGASRIGAREDADYPEAGHSRSREPTTQSRSREIATRRPGNEDELRQFPSADPSGVQSLIIQDSIALVENRIKGFREMRYIASDLGDWVYP